ncbi:MAG: hypothetical protein J6S67_22765 [Methanobrevibacter sp.]|nr:hypothetical protein [Methanobrevibacter sp.]
MALNNVKEIQIPDERYELLEYIHFNGNDYINTGFTPWNNFGFYIDIQWDANQINQYNGHGKITSDNRCFIGVDGSGKITYGSGATSGSISSSDPYTRHNYQINTSSSSAGKFYIDGTQVWSGNSNYVESNRSTMFIGAVNRGTSDYSYCAAKIYNIRFINNVSTSSVITWNLIPVRRKSDNVVGFLKIKANNTAPDFMQSVNGLLEAGPVIGTPNINVYKIEDSNNQIIWGSQTAFPYRRLEYIHFNGEEYILTEKPAANYYYLQFSLDSIVNDKFIFGANGDSTSAGAMRITNRTASTGYMQTRFGRNSSSNTNIAQISADTIYQMRLRILDNNTLFSALANSSGTVLGSNNFSAVSFTKANMNKFAIMGYGTGTTAGNTSAGKVYWYLKRQTDGASTILIRAYPCQRKSDGVCGLYDVLNSTFYPMEGTTITDGAAGPTVDEYWDLTAPA